MSDIIERLRGVANMLPRERGNDAVDDIMHEAADEIMALRAALAVAKAARDIEHAKFLDVGSMYITAKCEVADERKRALEEAAKALDAWGDIYGDNAAKTVRALKEPTK